MINRAKVIKGMELLHGRLLDAAKRDAIAMLYASMVVNAIALLKEQEAREPHYTTLKYRVDGTEVAVHHPECPRCIENGLVLWDAEIEKGQAYCKRCGQAVKWE